MKLFAFDLLICDVMMPEMDGIELVKTLRSTEATSNIPVIFITGSSYSGMNIEWLKADLKHKYLLPKICTWEVILEKVETILKKQPADQAQH